MEEIIIKVETVKVSELNSREKQIYDFAYNKGISDGDRNSTLTRIMASLGLIIVIIGLFHFFFLRNIN